MGARNVGASLSPLHSEVEALLWVMECLRNLHQFRVTFVMDCSQLLKMISKQEEWPVFASYLEDIKALQESFFSSEIVQVPRVQNLKADSLARCAKKTILSCRSHGCGFAGVVYRFKMSLFFWWWQKKNES